MWCVCLSCLGRRDGWWWLRVRWDGRWRGGVRVVLLLRTAGLWRLLLLLLLLLWLLLLLLLLLLLRRWGIVRSTSLLLSARRHARPLSRLLLRLGQHSFGVLAVVVLEVLLKERERLSELLAAVQRLACIDGLQRSLALDHPRGPLDVVG